MIQGFGRLLCAATIALLLPSVCAADPLRDGFRAPPQAAKPRVWWHWMNGNVTKDGIRRDLDWMNRMGIGGVDAIDASIDTPQVVVVNQSFVDRYFPGEQPLGQGIDIGNGTDGFYQIVGVVGSVRYEGLGSSPEPTMYVPFKQGVFSTMWIVARTDGDPVQQSSAVRQAVTSIDPSLPAYSIASLASIVSDSVAQRRFSMLLLGVFALIALFLAAIGLYGVVAYSVNQRTQEIGVRMAIGAQRGDVFRLIVGGGMKLAVIGVILGLAGALAAARVVETMLFGVTPFDPASYGTTAGVLLAVAALACYMPARRAMQVDPLAALRQE